MHHFGERVHRDNCAHSKPRTAAAHWTLKRHHHQHRQTYLYVDVVCTNGLHSRDSRSKDNAAWRWLLWDLCVHHIMAFMNVAFSCLMYAIMSHLKCDKVMSYLCVYIHLTRRPRTRASKAHEKPSCSATTTSKNAYCDCSNQQNNFWWFLQRNTRHTNKRHKQLPTTKNARFVTKIHIVVLCARVARFQYRHFNDIPRLCPQRRAIYKFNGIRMPKQSGQENNKMRILYRLLFGRGASHLRCCVARASLYV